MGIERNLFFNRSLLISNFTYYEDNNCNKEKLYTFTLKYIINYQDPFKENQTVLFNCHILSINATAHSLNGIEQLETTFREDCDVDLNVEKSIDILTYIYLFIW